MPWRCLVLASAQRGMRSPEAQGQLSGSGPDQGHIQWCGQTRGSPERDIIFSCPGWIPSRNTKAIRCRGQSQHSLFCVGSKLPTGRAGSQTVQALLGWGLPTRCEGDLGITPFPFTPREE